MKSLMIASGLALLVLASGCGGAEPAQSARGPVLPDPGDDQEYAVQFPDPGRGAARYIRITIAEDLFKSCGLVRAHFEFDSAALLPQDTATLRSVAECLERPELAEAQLEIVGRADSRGNRAYNLELGRKRAEEVKRLLVRAGISEDRIQLKSLGADMAVGDDKGMYSYGYDRRVDVVLSGIVRAPR